MIQTHVALYVELLAHNTELRTLRFDDINLTTYFNGDRTDLLYIPSLLCNITSPNIREVIFEIDLRWIEQLDMLYWSMMRDVFSRLPQVTRINFKVTAFKKETTAKIRAELPSEYPGRHVVRVSCPPKIPDRGQIKNHNSGME